MKIIVEIQYGNRNYLTLGKKKKGALVEELCNRNMNNLQYFSGIKGVIGEYNRMAKP